MKHMLKLLLGSISLSFVVFSATAVAIGSPQAHARQLVGFFTNMEMSPETLDCSGYSVWLYRIQGKLVGDFYFYQGDCATRKIPFEKDALDASGNLSFEVEQDNFHYNFSGKLSVDRLAGVMTVSDPVEGKDISNKKETLLKTDESNQSINPGGGGS